VNRAEARHLAEEWVLDASVLLAAGRWHAAYYLAGYAIECGLKACVLARIERTGIIFEDKKFAERCFTHKIDELVFAADLQAERAKATGANPALDLNWTIVKDWNVDIRYRGKTELEARKLYKAVTDPNDGVLPWIMVRW